MRVARQLAVSAATVLLLAAFVAAHGDDEGGDEMKMDMDMGHSDDALPGTNVNLTQVDGRPLDPTYFRLSQHSGTMYAHMALMVLAWIILLPVAVMLSVAKSKLKIPVQLAFLAVNGLGIFVSIIYNAQTEDLYPHNAHHPLGWAITWIAGVWIFMGIVQLYLQPTETHQTSPSQQRPLLHSLSQQSSSPYERVDNDEQRAKMEEYRWSDDSGQGTERNTESLCNSSRTQSWNSEMGNFPQRKEFEDDEDDDDVDRRDPLQAKTNILRRCGIDGVLSKHAPRLIKGSTVKVFSFFHCLLERTILILGFVGFCTGGVTYGGIFRGHAIFSGLAHWIKGGIFVWYGLFAFGRWMGCFADFGWAWNRKPNPNKLSSEFWESFVIFFYGASNVWLEHLASWGGAWSAIDFQHLSITIMFFGGGLLGMLIESRRVRELLNMTAVKSQDDNSENSERDEPDSYDVSLNPVPAIIILLLGIMMSSHTQHNMLAGMVHKQWGMLFTAGAMARAVTYLTMWLKPPTSRLPSRPPSEIIVGFCMLSGGAIFMASAQNTTDVMIQNHLDAMFIFTVIMGLTCLVLAWEVVVIVIKGWVVERQLRSRGKHSATRKTQV